MHLDSTVEKYYLTKSGLRLIYSPTEKIPVIQVPNFPELGKLTALRFLEWVGQNHDGVISLPTGKTPEYFIKWVDYLLFNWESKNVKKILDETNFVNRKKPDLSNLKFVQIDEFYPINPRQHNSFYFYINKYYLSKWGIKKKNSILINPEKIGKPKNISFDKIFPNNKVDLSLRTRWPSNRIERLQKDVIQKVDQFCSEYENKIQNLGGIGFFLGGIGPDGHIGFNVKGSDHFSTTRLTNTNYETQAASATDLGGIEISRNRLVITIGLGTITFNKNVTAIIIAAGESKSNIIRDSIQKEKSNKYPATVFQNIPNARFYITNGAAFRLIERRLHFVKKEKPISQDSIERAVINLSIEKNKSLKELTVNDIKSNILTNYILTSKYTSYKNICFEIYKNIISSLESGMGQLTDQVILHTAPHHDDIMLGYIPYITHLVREPSNKHHFSTFTSGFTSVTNIYTVELLNKLNQIILNKDFKIKFYHNYFNPKNIEGRNFEINQYLVGIAEHSKTIRDEATSKRLLRNIIKIFKIKNFNLLKAKIESLIKYFENQYPGQKDKPSVQKLKGMIREFEEELVWAFYGFNSQDVSHLRLKFYQGNIFNESPEIKRDVAPILNLLRKIKPTIVTLALDPEGSGPDTHYKVLQATTEAIKLYVAENKNNNLVIWGYRNVWNKFHPSEANLFIPVSLNSMAIMENVFHYCYGSQRNASFPSWEFDGPFSRLAQNIFVQQYEAIRKCLGKEFFVQHSHPRIRAAFGLCYIKKLTINELYKYSTELKNITGY
ncbi:MAG: glucosamine-6-phosphate deaminase [Bacteroidetes bacterium]|nr:glucosamine-6-phosphate deaminase [Bacteroidota bacterium]